MWHRRLLTVRRAVLGLAVLATLAAWAAAEERLLYEKTSAYNTILVTENERGLRTLRFERGGARQSVVKLGDPDHLELPYARVLPVAFALVAEPQRVLVVGLGGGSVPNFLRRHFPDLEIDAVDIDPDVVDVAKRFFGFREDARMRAYVEDGRKFIAARPQQYDIIFLDAFGCDNIPRHLATREFLDQVRAALRPGGVAVGNIWSRYSNPLYDSMVRTYREVFPRLYIVDIESAGNRILLALPRPQDVRLEDLASRAHALSRQRHFPFDLGQLIAAGFRDPGDDGARGRVLSDRDPPSKPE